MRIAINGFGRIGKNITRHLIEAGFLANQGGDMELVAINDLGKIESNAHLLKYDSIHGSITNNVTVNNDNIENIFENKKVVSEQNDHHHQEELKVVNSSENVQVEEKKIQASTSNRINSKTDYSIKEMDAAIKNIFEN